MFSFSYSLTVHPTGGGLDNDSHCSEYYWISFFVQSVHRSVHLIENIIYVSNSSLQEGVLLKQIYLVSPLFSVLNNDTLQFTEKPRVISDILKYKIGGPIGWSWDFLLTSSVYFTIFSCRELGQVYRDVTFENLPFSYLINMETGGVNYYTDLVTPLSHKI